MGRPELTDAALRELPWRGPGASTRPGLPLPPQPMPLRWRGTLRKRWRYVGAYDDSIMLCAALAQVGPVGQSFWAVWERQAATLHERTRRHLPGRRPEIRMQGRAVRILSGEVEVELRFGDGGAIESICPNGAGGYVWTRKLAGVPVEGIVRVSRREHRLRGRGVEDDSAGYHARRTSWHWSAGVGATTDGRALGWNLVSGVNDPPRSSERAIWIEGEASEPGPVAFEGRDGLDAIRFADGSRLDFRAEGERAHRESLGPLLRSSYRAPFGVFGGSLAGIEIGSGLGVMETHDAVW